MEKDIEQVEGQTEGQEGQTEQTPTVDLPTHPAGVSRDRQALIDEVFEEGTQNASEENVLDQLASKEGQLTVEDLRKLPGAEGLTDDQLKMEWARAVKAQKGEVVEGEGEGGQTPEAYKVPFPFYDPTGAKLEALEKIALRDLLDGKVKIGYNAFGKEQQKTLAETLRNASMGHWNEQKYTTAIEERNRVASDLAKAREEISTFSGMRKTWDAALTALSMGNIEPMKRLVGEWQTELTKSPQDIPGMVPMDQVRQEQEQVAQGNAFIRDTLVPAAMDLAQRYEADAKEILGAIESMIRREGSFLSKEKIDQIIQYEVPQLLEVNGYTAKGSVSQLTPQGGDIDELKKTVAALQSRIAEQKNQSTEAIRQRSKRIPPAGGGATPGAGDSMPAFKSRGQMKAWMQGDENWAKA